MKVKYQDKVILIADDSDNARKIASGHDFHLDEDGGIVIDAMGAGMKNKHQIKKILAKAKDLEDIKKVLSRILDLLDDNYDST